MDTKDDQLKAIRDEVLALKASPLYAARIAAGAYPVIGEGNHDAKLMFIGEAPGKNEAEQGRPFCGAAGRVLDELLEGAGIKREDVYITNIVKDRPPANRDPSPQEIALYGPFLDRQIDSIQPKIIATLGRFSMQYLLEKFGAQEAGLTIGVLHGTPIAASASYGPITIFPLYHPAAALYSGATKEVLQGDFQKLKEVVK
ncbi:MAG: uracil-DNA glycosylase [Candidatus Spechtbacterales bacterium]